MTNKQHSIDRENETPHINQIIDDISKLPTTISGDREADDEDEEDADADTAPVPYAILRLLLFSLSLLSSI